MKKLLLTLSFGVAFTSMAQNLVKNPGFDHSKKITYWSQIEKAEGWSNGNGGTVDLFDEAACKTNAGIPVNFAGEQAPANGRYAGFVAAYEDERISLVKTVQNLQLTDEMGYTRYAEYMQGELTEPLVAGQSYSFSYKVSLAEKSGRAVKGLGAYFSAEKLDHSNNRSLDYKPQIKSSELISDKNGWATVSGTFVAKGGEKYVTIGAFEGSSSSEKIVADKKDNDNKKAYYYVYGPTLVKGKKVANFNDLLSGDHVIFLTLNFELGSSTITSDSYEELDACAAFLKTYDDINIQIDGHTDASGTDAINVPLSKDRAAAVKTYLINKGVDGSRMSTEGYGSSKPLFTEQEVDIRNRRIELYKVD